MEKGKVMYHHLTDDAEDFAPMGLPPMEILVDSETVFRPFVDGFQDKQFRAIMGF